MLTGTFTEILAADVAVIVVVLLGVDVVLVGRASVVLLAGGAVVMVGSTSVVLLAGEAAVLLVVTVNVNHTFKIHDVILQEIDIVLKSYMYQSYNNMLTLVWLFTKLEENIFIFGSHVRLCFELAVIHTTIRGKVYAS